MRITTKKEYFIKVFLQRAKYDVIFQSFFDFNFNILKSNFTHVPEQEMEKIKKEYDANEYFARAFPIIDKRFTEEELSKIVDFYSSPAGKKVVNIDFGKEMAIISKGMFDEIQHKLISLNEGKKIEQL